MTRGSVGILRACQRASAWVLGVLLLAPAASAAPSFSFAYVDDAELDFQSRGWLDSSSLFQANVRAAATLWGGQLDTTATLYVQVGADRTVSRTGGTFSNGRFLGATAQGNLFEPGPLSRILVGTNAGGPPDIFIRINAGFVDAHYWLDPTPNDRTDQAPPAGRTDLVSIIAHELGHALGIGGTRNVTAGAAYGTFPGYLNPFDALSFFGGTGNPLASDGSPNPMFFAGANSTARYGAAVPLSHVGPDGFLHSQDFYHLGTCGDPPALTGSLMNGCSVPVDGSVLSITALDRALIQDLGYPVTSEDRTTDHDADRKNDVVAFHAASGLWFIRHSSDLSMASAAFGGAGYQPVAADYDGDGRMDLAVFHAPTGLWFIRQSSNLAVVTVPFGGSAYTPVPRDYDGDGRADVAVYHSASGQWFIRKSSDLATLTVGFGGPGYTPVPRDYDGDRKADIAVYHAASGHWFIRRSTDLSMVTAGYGGAGYDPVPRDYDGDGKADLAVYHAASGLWFIRPSGSLASVWLSYGGPGYAPVAGDYDGDGKADVAVYHAATGLWFIRRSSDLATSTVPFGGSAYTPVND